MATKRATTPAWDTRHGQFLRIETYAQKQGPNPKTRKPGSAQTVGAVIREVIREPEYSRHVAPERTKRTPPVLVYQNLENVPQGASVSNWGQGLEEYLNQRHETAFKTATRTRNGQKTTYQQKIQDSQNTLLAGVVSLPRGDTETDVKQWVRDSVSWLKKTYPDGQLKGVVLHRDESHPHLHFYAVSNRDDLDAGYLHAGVRARKTAIQDAQKQGLKRPGKAALDRLYKDAMKGLQSSYFNAVSRHHNLKRRADIPYRRLPLEEYKMFKWYERRSSKLLHQQGVQNADFQRRIEALEQKQARAIEMMRKSPNAWQLRAVFRISQTLSSSKNTLALEQARSAAKLQYDRDILELQKQAAETAIRQGHEFTVRSQHLVQETKEAKQSLNKALHRLHLYEDGFKSPEEAVKYSRLARAVAITEKRLEARGLRADNVPLATLTSRKPATQQALEQALRLWIDNLFDRLRLAREQRALEQAEQQRAVNRIRNKLPTPQQPEIDPSQAQKLHEELLERHSPRQEKDQDKRQKISDMDMS